MPADANVPTFYANGNSESLSVTTAPVGSRRLGRGQRRRQGALEYYRPRGYRGLIRESEGVFDRQSVDNWNQSTRVTSRDTIGYECGRTRSAGR